MMSVVKNMFRLTPFSHVFITRQYYLHEYNIGHIFRGKKPNWLLNHPSKYHALFRYIDKKLYHYAVVCMPDTIDDDLFDSIQIYFKVSDEEIDSFKHTLKECSYDNKVHIAWAIICFFLFPEHRSSNNVRKSTIYIACSDSEYNEMVGIHEDPVPLSNLNNPQIYKTLDIKRKYAINTKCIGFQLMRNIFKTEGNLNDIDNMKKIISYHWEFYAYECPLWKGRFNEYNITVDQDNHKIVFHNDDELESFYSQFGYYPDEQTSETLNKGLDLAVPDNTKDNSITIGGWKDWYDDLFTDKSIFEFDSKFKFKY